MKRKSLMKILAGTMAAVLFISSPAAAAAPDAVMPFTDQEMTENGETSEEIITDIPDENGTAEAAENDGGKETPDADAVETSEENTEKPDENTVTETAEEGDAEDGTVPEKDTAEDPEEVPAEAEENAEVSADQTEAEETVEAEEPAEDEAPVEEEFSEFAAPIVSSFVEYDGRIDWQIEDNKLTVEGTGNFRDPLEASGAGKAPWCSHAEQFTSAVVTLTDCTKLDYMFQNCAALESVDLSELDAEDVLTAEDVQGMFEGCSELKSVITPKNLKVDIELPDAGEGYAWYLEDETETQKIPAADASRTISRKEKASSETPPETPPETPDPSEIAKDTIEAFAEQVGEEPSEAREIKRDIWMAGFIQDTLEYTGSAVVQDIRVYDRTTLLKKGTDYSLIYKNNTAAKKHDADGAPCMTIKLMKQYAGSKDFPYTILQKDISETSISGQETALNYNGKAQEFKPVIKYRGKTLKKEKDYTIQYSGDTTGSAEKISKVTYTVQGTGNFTGTYPGEYYIVGANYNLSKASVSVDPSALKYYGEPISKEKLNITVKIKGQVLEPANYDVELINFDDAGTGTLIIRPSEQGKAKYAGRFVKNYKIVGGVNFGSAVSVDESVWKSAMKYSYKTINETGGMKQNTDGLLKDGSTVLKEIDDYTVTYKNNTKTGKAKVTFTGRGRYNGTITRSFKIEADDVLEVTAPSTAVYAKNGAMPEITVKDRDGFPLKLNKDYTLKLTDHKKCGTASYKVTGKGNYAKSAVKEGTFTVTPAPLASACIVTAPDKVYKNKKNAYRSTPVLYDRQNNKKLKAGTDYNKDFVYQKKQGETYVGIGEEEVLPAGTTVKVIVTGAGNYEGSCSADYKVYETTCGIGKLYVKIDPQVYTGEEIKPELADGTGAGGIHVYLSKGDMEAELNELYAPDYLSIVPGSYKKNINVGTASVTLRGAGEYGGQKTYKFKIIPKSIELVGVSSVLVKKSSLNVSTGDTSQLTVSVLPANADPWTVKWSSEDPEVATVNESGFVTAVSAGTTSVKASVTDAKGEVVTGSCKVFVDQNIIVLGATPNDGKDDTQEFNEAIRKVSAKNKGVDPKDQTVLWVPEGVYHIDVSDEYKKIEMKYDNVSVVMDDNAVLQALPTSRSEYFMVWIAGAKNVSFTGGKVIGDRNSHKGSSGEDGHCIAVLESRNVTIENVDVSYGWGDGIYVGIYSGNYGNEDRYVKDVTIKNCSVHHNRRNNIAITNGDNINILNSTLKNHGKNEGICIETNKDSVPVTNVHVSGCEISGSVKEAVGVVRPAIGVTFKNCKINGNAYNGACKGLVFDNCKITGDLTEVNHKKYSNFALAQLINGTTIGGSHIK